MFCLDSASQKLLPFTVTLAVQEGSLSPNCPFTIALLCNNNAVAGGQWEKWSGCNQTAPHRLISLGKLKPELLPGLRVIAQMGEVCKCGWVSETHGLTVL